MSGEVQMSGEPGWRVIAEQECRNLWIGGRGPLLLVVLSVLLSAISYLGATNQVLDYLAQREAVDLTLTVAVGVGVLMTLIVGADTISGERERGTLEALLLAPVSRRAVVLGKLTGAMSLWLAAFVVSLPYVWVLGHGAQIVGPALLAGFLVGTLLALGLATLAVLVSAASSSNRVSLSVCLLALLALYAPTQLSTSSSQGWLGELLTRLNPVGSGLSYVSALVVGGSSWTEELPYLASPLLAAALATAALLWVAPRIVRLTTGVSGE
jgi:ABC-2 type transport system permease protein